MTKVVRLFIGILAMCAVPAFAITVTGTAGCTSGVSGITSTLVYNPTGVTDPAGNVSVSTPFTNAGTNPGCTTNFLSESSGQSTTLTFSQPVDYVGFVWGTPDGYNTFQIYNGTTLLGSYTGSAVTNNYMNFFASGQNFTSVVFSSTGCCFETTDLSYQLAAVTGAPEPDTFFLPVIAGGAWFALRKMREKRTVRA